METGTAALLGALIGGSAAVVASIVSVFGGEAYTLAVYTVSASGTLMAFHLVLAVSFRGFTGSAPTDASAELREHSIATAGAG